MSLIDHLAILILILSEYIVYLVSFHILGKGVGRKLKFLGDMCPADVKGDHTKL